MKEEKEEDKIKKDLEMSFDEFLEKFLPEEWDELN